MKYLSKKLKQALKSNQKFNQNVNNNKNLQQQEQINEQIVQSEENMNKNQAFDDQKNMVIENNKDSMSNQEKQQKQQYYNQHLQNDDNIHPQNLSQKDNRGVCFISRIPPYMKPNYIKKLLDQYDVQRVYFVPQSQWIRKKRIKNGGNKKICFKEGWIQFTDKKVARMVALTLNGQRMVNKKGSFYHQDLWTLKYLPKFKWHHLTQRLAHQERLKRERLNVQLSQQQKVDQFYSQQIYKSKLVNAIAKRKEKKGQFQIQKQRNYKQSKILKQQNR